MRSLKKFMAVGLAAAMVFSMTACSSKPAETAAPETQAETTAETTAAAVEEAKTEAAEAVEGKDPATVKVGISIYQFADNFMTVYRQELEKYLTEELGVKKENISIMDGKNDQGEQMNQIRNFITTGVDVMIINLVQASSEPTVTEECAKANIPVVYINREPEAEREQAWKDEGIKATYVGADARQSGTFQGEEIAELENKGDADGDGVVRYIMVQGDPENVDAQYRTEKSVEALKASGVEVEELVKMRGDWDQTKGQEITANALAQHGAKIDVVFCNNDAMALGALQAIEAAGRKVNEDIYLVGVDALVEAVENVMNNKMTGTVFNDYIGQAHTAADKAMDFVNGKDVDNVYMVDYVKVTTENAAEILDLVK
ncbi:substrate-binding domain-containing protein [[Clostridium] symbiosum]|uniref:substrate-binding domain-containing protein n=1 Tax=Clostridium symbiosum TaxID=1512 RepID=UPI001D0939E9|nr:substrate-binding domain-containing protein [[Clostridium] symbiosum]MCB6611594.1 substrate-binding domain-containing protein [[Clostridium] symbiosum]MCB6933437.1 substrate-binding domain-containing protein [[Clostridium] symbiosum]